MTSVRTIAILAAGLATPTAALAQTPSFYLGAEGGLGRRQARTADTASPEVERGVRSDGFDYGVVAGAEMPLSRTVFAGVEAGLSRSEAETDVTIFRGIELIENVFVGVLDRTVVRQRWAYAVTGRVGLQLSSSAAAYGLIGIGGERVRVRSGTSTDLTGEPDGGDVDLTVRSDRGSDDLVFGGGARLFFTDHVGARIEYRRLETDDDADPQQFMAGLLYRF